MWRAFLRNAAGADLQQMTFANALWRSMFHARSRAISNVISELTALFFERTTASKSNRRRRYV
jgi:hypothetical protein